MATTCLLLFRQGKKSFPTFPTLHNSYVDIYIKLKIMNSCVNILFIIAHLSSRGKNEELTPEIRF